MPAPSSTQLNLRNTHFHKNAEHKAKAFATYAGVGDGHDCESGHLSGISKESSPAEPAPTQEAMRKGEHGELKPGDTIKVHWVHSSCDIKPGTGLESCLAERCSNPKLSVESQEFTLVDDANALSCNDMDCDGNIANGYHQHKSIPSNTCKPVALLGSTTGAKYSEECCSPWQITWSVHPQCAEVDINSVGEWCKGNQL